MEFTLDQPFEGRIIHYDQPGTALRYQMPDMLELYKEDNPFDQSIAFVKAILEGRPVPVSVETGLYDLKVVKAVYKSAETGMRVKV